MRPHPHDSNRQLHSHQAPFAETGGEINLVSSSESSAEKFEDAADDDTKGSAPSNIEETPYKESILRTDSSRHEDWLATSECAARFHGSDQYCSISAADGAGVQSTNESSSKCPSGKRNISTIFSLSRFSRAPLLILAVAFAIVGSVTRSFEDAELTGETPEEIREHAFAVLLDDDFPGAGAISRSHRYFRTAARRGNSDAWIGLALQYEHEYKDYKKAVAYYRAAAEAGNSIGLQVLAGYYLNGTPPLQKDLAKAIRLFSKAADLSTDGGAERELGNIYDAGKELPRDVKLARYWYERGAAKGDHEAESKAGQYLFRGIGGPRNIAQALEWLEHASEADGAAAAFLADLYFHGTDVKQDYKKALDYYEEAGCHDQPRAFSQIGLMYEKGLGVAKDRWQAVSYYRQASDIPALRRLGESLEP